MDRKRAVIYCRVSSEKQKIDGESLEYQETKCRQYAELHGILVVAVLSEAKSGFIHYMHRDKLTLARQMVRDQLVDAIIVWDLRRFSRNFVHSAMIFQELESYGGEVISVSENIDNSLTGKLIRSILAWSAESEREKIAEYANRHWQKRHELGLPMATTTPPYGWQWGDKEKTFYVLDMEEAAVRRSIFEMFGELDMSIRQIGHKLTVDGIPTPQQARKPPPEDEEGKPKLVPWTTGTIHMYLKDPANIGTLIICKKKKVLLDNGHSQRITHPDQKVVPGAMPPIVSPELFERAQRKLQTNRETKSQLPRDPEAYLLVGHIYCGLCGNRMHPIAEKGLPTYRCNKHLSVLDANPHCEPHVLRIRAAFADAFVWHDCSELFERLDLIQSRIEAEVDRSVQELLEDTTGQEQIMALKTAITQAKHRYDQQPDEYVRTLIAQDILAKQEQLVRYEAECKTAVNMAAVGAVYRQQVLNFVQFVNVMKGEYHSASFQQKRNALDVLGATAVVYPSTQTPPIIQVESEQEWLAISEAAELAGMPRTTLQHAVNTGLLKTEQRTEHQIMVRREAAREYQQRLGKDVNLAAYEDEWFSLHRLRLLGVANYPILNRDIAAGVLPAEQRTVSRTVIHRDELNRFLRESPVKSRVATADVSERVEVTYSPIFTGVQASKDATTPIRMSFSLSDHAPMAIAIHKFELLG